MNSPTGDDPERRYPQQGPPPQNWPPPQGPPPQGWPPPRGWPQQQWPQPGPYNPQPGWGAGPPPSGKPPGGGNGKIIALIGLAVVLVVAAVATITVIGFGNLGSNGDDSVDAAGSSSVATSADTAEPSNAPSPSTVTSECPPPTAGPETPAGWQTVSGKRGLSYDVPADWEVESCDALVGWETPCEDGPFGFCPVRTMSGAATLQTAACPDNSVGIAGLPGASDTSDINVAVRAEADLVKAIYTSESGKVPSVRLSAPREFTIGGAPAVQIAAAVTGIETSPCVGATAVHSMIATTVPGQQGCVLFVISLPQGIAGAVAPADGDRMVSTLRRTG